MKRLAYCAFALSGMFVASVSAMALIFGAVNLPANSTTIESPAPDQQTARDPDGAPVRVISLDAPSDETQARPSMPALEPGIVAPQTAQIRVQEKAPIVATPARTPRKHPRVITGKSRAPTGQIALAIGDL